MSEEPTPQETTPEQEAPADDEDCLACDALDYFCDTIEDFDTRKKCRISTKAVQDGLLDADSARQEIMTMIGEDKYQKSVDKVNLWLSEKFEGAREAMREARTSYGEDESVSADRHLLPDEPTVSEEPLDKSKKMLPED